MEFVDAAQVQALSREPGSAKSGAKYLAAMLADGPRAYADNADVEMQALLVDGTLLPVVLNRGAAGGAETCSPYSHYVSYTVAEVSRRNPRVPAWLFSAGATPAGHLLRLAGIESVVSVNNWLLSTNPSVCLNREQVQELTACLAGSYPGRAILWRSLNPSLDGAFIECLRQSGYRLLRSRLVYVSDPGPQLYRNHSNARRDLTLLKHTKYKVVSDHQSLAPYAERMTELFRSLYLRKHSVFNTAFNSRFFALALACGLFEFRGFLADGQLDAFAAFFTTDRIMTGSLLGYDLNRPRSLGLYRMAIATFLDQAASRGLRLNLSAGADSFKAFRGGIPVDEYDAVYDRHLPASRRSVWVAMSAVTRAAGAWRARGRGASAAGVLPPAASAHRNI